MEPLKQFAGGVLAAAVLLGIVAAVVGVVVAVFWVGDRFGPGWAMVLAFLLLGGLAGILSGGQ
jgi:hypothetical protein